MRQITLKYSGECRVCGKEIEAGQEAIYEKRVGIFCLTCAPTDPETIREFRQEAADRKADKYDEWATKRRIKASALHKQNEPYRGDIAFCTQPGRFPLRDKVNRRSEKAWEHSKTAQTFEHRAAGLRAGVRVKGDADKRWRAKREAVLAWLKIGTQVDTCHYGLGTVKKINRKTAKIINCGVSKTYETNVDLAFLSPVA